MRQLLFLAGPVVASFALIHCVGDAPAVPIDAGTDAPVTGDGSADTSSDVAADTGKPCDPLPDGGTGFLDDAVGISAGDDFTCAVRLNGDVLCWGSNSPYQQLAQPIGNLMRSSVPVRITGFPTKVVKVSAGQGQGKALDDQRHAWSWGSNIFGEAGTNEAYGIFLNAPHKVVGVSGTGSLDNVVDVSAGEDHACAADSTGKVYCWGEAGNGRLGSDVLNDAGQPKTNIPVATKTLAGTALAVSAANTFTCAIVRDGSSQLRCEKGAKVRLALRSDAEPGSLVSLTEVLLVGAGEDVQIGTPLVAGAKVTARVAGESKGPKLIVYRYRRRKNSDKKRGHRQHYTEAVVESIETGK